ncbi:receptor-like protein kinase BRI1-like 3 [Pistacia vera]|uniref:receptor-like protein kinase BRI1-like 3 n=1 Tax=Pistacia vera TaxID=55513 RepID=UPI001262F4F2|nr:receptor-like protein kinase BRI1-like 3 [Pistacia vera]
MSSSSTPSAASTSVEEFPSTISHFPVSPPGWSSRTAVDGSFKLHPFPNPSLTNTNTIPGMISIRIQQLCVPIQDGEFHRRTKTKVFIMIVAQIALTLSNFGSMNNSTNKISLTPFSESLLEFAKICNISGFICFIYSILVCPYQNHRIVARILTGMGIVATTYGLLAHSGAEYIVGNFDGDSKNKRFEWPTNENEPLCLEANWVNTPSPVGDGNDPLGGPLGLEKSSLALSKSQFQGQVPSWISNLRKLQFLDFKFESNHWFNSRNYRLRKKIGGSRLELPLFIPPNINASNEEYYSLLSLPPSIFLQNNSLSGSIPIQIGQLHFLQLLNLSYNKFSGNIPDQISKLTNLERLDLSGNNLSGEIPASLSGLYSLSEFSVANNNLHGLIPSGGQFHTFSISNFEGNPGLCGDIIEISCSIQTRTNNNPVPSPSESSKKELVYGLTAGVVFGFIIGSVGGIFLPNSCI